jgi:hypothetical protein
MSLACVIKHVKTSHNNTIGDVRIRDINKNQSIGSSTSKIYACPFNSAFKFEGDYLIAASVQIEYAYEQSYIIFSKTYSGSSVIFNLNTRVFPPVWESEERLK